MLIDSTWHPIWAAYSIPRCHGAGQKMDDRISDPNRDHLDMRRTSEKLVKLAKVRWLHAVARQ